MNTEKYPFEIYTKADVFLAEKNFKTIDDLREYLRSYPFKNSELLEVCILHVESTEQLHVEISSFDGFGTYIAPWVNRQLKPAPKMADTLKGWVRTQYDDDELRDIISHGCINGVAGLCYYSETGEIYEEYEHEIWELAVKQTEDCGYQNVIEFIGTFGGAKNVYSSHTFKNLMVWYAVEAIARQLIEEPETDNGEE